MNIKFQIGDVVQVMNENDRNSFGRIVHVSAGHVFLEDFPTVGESITTIPIDEFNAMEVIKIDGTGFKQRWTFSNGKFRRD